MKTRSSTVLVLLLATLAACGDSPAGPRDPSELTFATELNVNLSQMTRTNSGLYYRDEIVGQGPVVQIGHRVTVHYTGWLHDGTKFDSSVDRNQPITVTGIGNANVIAGWNEGLIGMRVGGRRLLVIPSQLAYGAHPPGPAIPRHATLVFRVEVLSTGP